MFKFILLVGALSAVASAAIIEQSNGNHMGVTWQFLTPAEMDEFSKKYPNAQQFNVDHSLSFNNTDFMGESREILGLSLGQRQTGDRVVFMDQDINSWNVLTSRQLQFVFPWAGSVLPPVTITRVTMGVQRSNYLGRAYVTAGGIGQNNIAFVLESYNTYMINYILDIYGI